MPEDTDQVLLRCPHCGAQARTQARVADDGSFTISCLQCGCIGPDANDEAEAIWWWNRRSPSVVTIIRKSKAVVVGLLLCILGGAVAIGTSILLGGLIAAYGIKLVLDFEDVYD